MMSRMKISAAFIDAGDGILHRSPWTHSSLPDHFMSTEINTLVEEIKQSAELLRRRL